MHLSKDLSVIQFAQISESELFKSNHLDIIKIESILRKCQILSISEYDKCEDLSEDTFFSRASFDLLKNKLTPKIENWDKSCICELPLNPDQMYVNCDKCSNWFHPKHVGLEEIEAEVLEEFCCPKCIIK